PVDIVDDNWHHIAFIMPGSGQTDITNAEMYADGQAQTGGNTSTSEGQKSKSNFLIAKGAGSYYGKGIFDEIRISNITRNASWITTCYNTMNSPSTFLNVGSEEIQ
ncbi:MAG: LamG-like jellyroll fold domain-containing protein, partial [Petrotogales bacterium]